MKHAHNLIFGFFETLKLFIKGSTLILLIFGFFVLTMWGADQLQTFFYPRISNVPDAVLNEVKIQNGKKAWINFYIEQLTKEQETK